MYLLSFYWVKRSNLATSSDFIRELFTHYLILSVYVFLLKHHLLYGRKVPTLTSELVTLYAVIFLVRGQSERLQHGMNGRGLIALFKNTHSKAIASDTLNSRLANISGYFWKPCSIVSFSKVVDNPTENSPFLDTKSPQFSVKTQSPT